MRKNLKTLLICLLMVVCVTSLFLVSCVKPQPEEKTYTVTLMVDGANWKQEKVNEGETYTPATPTKNGYEFGGWYAAEDFSGEAVAVLTVNADTTLYSKWIALTKVNLVLDGGQLSQTTVYVRNGESIYNAVSELVPTKANAQFDAWYNGDTALKTNVKADGTEITLTAQYKYKYVIEIFEQNKEQTDYVAAQPFEGYARVGETIKVATVIADRPGFIRTAGDTGLELTVSANVADNKLSVRFDRKTITVTFQFDYPDGVEYTTLPEDKVVTVVYGEEISMPTEYTCEGYYLYGWSAVNDVNVVYKTNYIENHLYNAPVTTPVAPDRFVPTEDVVLVPVWVEGYVDMFGGSDAIYVFDKESEDCYLQRGGYFFKGEFDKDDDSFFFEINDENVIAGRINDEHVIFMYSDAALNGLTAVYYSYITGVNQNTTIAFNGYDQITFTEQVEGVDVISKGVFYIDQETGLYEITFTSGTRQGTKMVVMLGKLTNGAYAFLVRNDEYKYGRLVRLVATENGTSYYTSAYFIEFSGFGTCKYYQSSTQSSTLTYEKTSEDEFTLYNNGSVFGVIKVTSIEFPSGKVYGYYVKVFDEKITMTAEDGTKLDVDEYGFATYTDKDGKSTNGFFSNVTSYLYGTMVKFISENGSIQHLFTYSYDEDTKVYTLTAEKSVNYADFYYEDAKGVYYAPLIVLNDPTEGAAAMYGYTNKKEFVKVSEGTYTYDADLNRYTYTATTIYDNYDIYVKADAEAGIEGKDGVFIEQYDYRTLKSVEFTTAYNTRYKVNVTYWYSYTTTDGNKVDRTVTYSCTNEEGKTSYIVKVDGYVSYINYNGVSFAGTLSTDETTKLTTLTLTVGNNTGNLYVELNDEELTFVTYVTAPYTAYEMGKNGSATNDKYITFTGKDYSATYTVVISRNEETKEVTEQKDYVGTYSIVKNGEENAVTNISGMDIYKFVGATVPGEGEQPETIEFTFIQFATSSYYIFSKQNTEDSTEYYTKDNMTSLKLDGYGYGAEYMVSGEDGFVVQGVYYFENEKTICLIATTASGSSYTFYFDIQADGTITVRGSEYRTYLFVENNNITAYLDFDGYGNLLIYNFKVDEETGELVKDENGDYVKEVIGEGTYDLSGDFIVLTYTTKSGAQVVVNGLFGYYSYNSKNYYAFYRQYGEVKGSYISDEDWSVLILDGFGFATRYSANGTKETGTYAIVTENVLYYCNDAQDDACIYIYDVLTGKATSCQYTGKNYFAENLEALNFSKYGFAYFGGTERLYYTLNENNEVILYHYEPENVAANAYGYVVEEGFGTFGETVVYKGVTYYTNSGYALTFTRQSETAAQYPVNVTINEAGDKIKCTIGTLSFTPTGAKEFKVSGQVTLVNTAYGFNDVFNCTVVREYEGDKVVTYVDLSGYRWYIDISFHGEESADYSVNGFEFEVELASYAWTNSMMYILYLMFYGIKLPDTQYGPIYVHIVYDQEGKVVTQTITSAFLETSGYEIAGNLIVLEDAEFTIDSKGSYTIGYKGADGNDYTIHILNTGSAYMIAAVTRTQVLDCGDYKVKLERTVWGEYFKENAVYNYVLIVGDEEVPYTYILEKEDGTITYIVKDTDEKGIITKTTFYHITLVDDEEVEEGFKFYKSATVVKEDVETIYDAYKSDYVDIDSKGNVVLFKTTIGETTSLFLASDTVYINATNSYLFRSGSAYFIARITVTGEGDEQVKTVTIIPLTVISDATGENTIYVNANSNGEVLAVRRGEDVSNPTAFNYDALSDTYRITMGSSEYFVIVVKDELSTNILMEEVTYVYSSTGAQWIAISKTTGKVVAFSYSNRISIPTEQSYNESTKTYTITTKDGTYNVVVGEDGYITISVAV